jgi:hypothetical protein
MGNSGLELACAYYFFLILDIADWEICGSIANFS